MLAIIAAMAGGIAPLPMPDIPVPFGPEAPALGSAAKQASRRRPAPPPLIVVPPPPQLMLPSAPPPSPLFVPPPPPPPASPPSPPRQIAGSIDTDDYPVAAIRVEAEGISQIRIQIDAGGLVTGCTIEQSSGHEALDTAACGIVRRRFLFRSATRNGAAMPSTTMRRIRWELPVDQIAFGQGRFSLTVEGDAAGFADCRLELSGAAFAAFDHDQCGDAERAALVNRFAMQAGHPAVRVRETLTLVPEGEARTLPRLGAAGLENLVAFSIEPDGSVTRCTTEVSRDEVPDYVSPAYGDLCAMLTRRRRFAPAPDGQPRRARMQAAVVVEVLVPPAR